MSILIIETQRSFYLVVKNENGSLTLKKGFDQKEISNAGHTIFNFGGVDGTLAKCVEYDSLEDYLAFKRERSAKVQEERDKRNKEYEVTVAKRLEEETLQLEGLLKLDTIPATMANIELVIAWLSRQNWGGWSLPKMSIGYSAAQYDCDGKMVTTMKFDKKVDGGNMFKTPAPKGHLEKYQTIRV